MAKLGVDRARETHPDALDDWLAAEHVHRGKGVLDTIAIHDVKRGREKRPSALEHVPTACRRLQK